MLIIAKRRRSSACVSKSASTKISTVSSLAWTSTRTGDSPKSTSYRRPFFPRIIACVISLLSPALLLQFLDPMVVIIGDGRSERHRSGHPDLSKRDNQRLSFFRWDNVTDNSTVVPGIRHIRDDRPGLVCGGDLLRSQVS